MRASEVVDVLRGDGGADTRSFDLGGTIRSREAADTLDYIRSQFTRFGITRLADVTGLDLLGVPVAMCVRPNAGHISVSQGKGISIDLAMASAAMESIEMHHAEHAPAPDCTSAWDSLGQDAARPTSFELGVKHGEARDRLPIGWVESADLISGDTLLVPHALIDLDSTRAHPDTGLFAVSSNGLASGNCLIEAVLHAIFEVIERDADLRFGLLTPAAQETRRLDLDRPESEHIEDLVTRIRQGPDTRLDAWDITSEVGVPAYRATVRDNDMWRNLGSFVGSGCHRSPVIALSRALTEAAQTRLTLIAGSRDDVFPSHYVRRAASAGQTLLPGPVSFDPQSDLFERGAAFHDDLADVLARLRRVGAKRVLVFDHTEPDLDIAVVKVMIPALRMKRLEP